MQDDEEQQGTRARPGEATPSRRRRVVSLLWRRGLPFSLLLHVAGLALASAWMVDWQSASTGTRGRRVARLLPEEPVPEQLPELEEPSRQPEVPETASEPELVEQPPEYPDPPEELLDWIPPVDLLASVERLRQPVASPPPAELEPPAPSAVASAPTQPEVGEPIVLEGPSLPAVLDSPQPRYPRQALRLGWEGSVTLLVMVDAAGLVTSARVETSSGHSVLDDEALAAFRRWRFCPRQPGDPAERLIRKRFTFRLP